MRKILSALIIIPFAVAAAEKTTNWPQWRGPTGHGLAPGESTPTTWSETKNLKWKLALPGAGSSSPIVWNDRAYLTCYSGYGTGDNFRDSSKLMRHIVCVNAKTGQLIWKKDLKPTHPVNRFGGLGLPEHGYSSGTPATDGESLFVCFGSSGVIAFDMEGKQLWRTDIGADSNFKRWGSATSPILYKNLVFINAMQEGHKIMALDKKTGRKVWSWGPDNYDYYHNTYGNPAIVETKTGTELVLAVNHEIWAFNPLKGSIKWYAKTVVGISNVSPSILAHGEMLFAFGGNHGNSAGTAIRAGGKDNVSKANIAWTSKRSPYIASPVYHKEHIYWMDRNGYALCINAKTGKEVYRERLKSSSRIPKFYASPVVVDGKIISVSRNAGAFVLEAKPKFKQLAQNIFESDRSVFNASPAISNNRLFLRSDTHLYCVAGE